jgi:hypothetical protein
MTITALPAAPSRSDPPATFITKADAFIAALPQFGAELNAMGTAYNLATTTTSSSSVLIGTGSKTFTIPAGLGFVIGQSLTISSTASPANRMYGQVTSYSGTTLVVNVTIIGGSGTLAAWTIALAAEILGATLGANAFTGHQTMATGAALNESISTLASSATPDIWSAQSNVINYTGTVTAIGFAAAPQAGVRRTLILAGAASFTAGPNMLIDGVVSFTGAAGDVVEVIAVTTTQFRLKIMRADGTAKDSVLPGTIIDFAGASAPSGYLLCPTAATNVSRTTYAALFAAIGTTWGAGDGSTTFGIPWFPADYAAVQANGNVGTNSVGVVLAHTHSIPLNAGSGSTYAYGLSAGNSATQLSVGQTPAGGSANLAAGVRVLRCVKY